jgi:hypothetical protein
MLCPNLPRKYLFCNCCLFLSCTVFHVVLLWLQLCGSNLPTERPHSSLQVSWFVPYAYEVLPKLKTCTYVVSPAEPSLQVRSLVPPYLHVLYIVSPCHPHMYTASPNHPYMVFASPIHPYVYVASPNYPYITYKFTSTHIASPNYCISTYICVASCMYVVSPSHLYMYVVLSSHPYMYVA